ncbi:hypothetical protein ACQKP0_09765 [Heyndrickxia sp. NPDC080065]|uniref:hypothetical protein n=1 Tax=Heyndrickxia sp. NPDC080065 TaxID=3390568 RepID=UPI003D05EA19
MKEEISKLLTLVKEDKIDNEEATELLYLLKVKEEGLATQKSADYLNKTLKISIQSEDGDNINVNLPIKLILSLLKVGHNIAKYVPDAEKYMKGIDMDLLTGAIENELEGQIVDIQSADGDNVSIIIE